MKNLLICFLVMVVAASCSSIKVSTDYDKTAPFASYKTFKFSEHAQKLPVNELNRSRLMNAIVEELNKKGMQESATPDVLIDLNIIIKEEMSATATTTSPYGYGYGAGYYGHGYGYGYGTGYSTTNIDYNKYLVGTVFIDFIDATKNQLVWQGRATGTINEDASGKTRTKNINAGVKKVFVWYPPKIK
jgi:hypothetical protein